MNTNNIEYARKIGILVFFPLSSILILYFLSFVFSITKLEPGLNLETLLEFKAPTLIIIFGYIFLVWYQTPNNTKDLVDRSCSLLSNSSVVVFRTNLYLFPLILILFVIYTFRGAFHGDLGAPIFVMVLIMGIIPLVLAFAFQILISIFSAGLIYSYLARKHITTCEANI